MAKTQFDNLKFYLLACEDAKEALSSINSFSNSEISLALAPNLNPEYHFRKIIKPKVDYLLNHYGKIFIGALSGYFPYDFTEGLRNEMIRFHEIEAIREYYTFIRKSFLSEALSAYCAAINEGTTHYYFGFDVPSQTEDIIAGDFFNEFLILNREVEHDKAVKSFLSSIEENDSRLNYSIDNFSSKEAIVSFPETDEIEWDFTGAELSEGAIRFAQFLCNLRNLLENIFTLKPGLDAVVSSAIWHFYGFYLETMNADLQYYFESMLNRISDLVNEEKEEFSSWISSENADYLKLVSGIKAVIDRTKQDIFILLSNEKYKNSLRLAVSNQLYGIGNEAFAPLPVY